MKMIYDFECGIPVGDILSIIYYIKRKYFKDDNIMYSDKFKQFVYDLVLAKGIPEDKD